ncbi:MAG: hypothetical protein MJ252_27875 [archaeon]|nr:hypothetical protein [archaeon]
METNEPKKEPSKKEQAVKDFLQSKSEYNKIKNSATSHADPILQRDDNIYVNNKLIYFSFYFRQSNQNKE